MTTSVHKMTQSAKSNSLPMSTLKTRRSITGWTTFTWAIAHSSSSPTSSCVARMMAPWASVTQLRRIKTYWQIQIGPSTTPKLCRVMIWHRSLIRRHGLAATSPSSTSATNSKLSRAWTAHSVSKSITATLHTTWISRSALLGMTTSGTKESTGGTWWIKISWSGTRWRASRTSLS